VLKQFGQEIGAQGGDQVHAQVAEGGQAGQDGNECIALGSVALGMEQLLELIEHQQADRAGVRRGGIDADEEGPGGGEGFGGGQAQRVQGQGQRRQRLASRAQHGVTHTQPTLVVVGFEGRDEAGLGERGFAATAGPGDKQQHLLGTRLGELRQRRRDGGHTPGVALALGIGVGAQAQVGVGEPRDVVGLFFGDDLVTGDKGALALVDSTLGVVAALGVDRARVGWGAAVVGSGGVAMLAVFGIASSFVWPIAS
jgi:hypothetical protein